MKKTLLLKLTEPQANMLRYAAEYKLEQDEDGDGLSNPRERWMMIRALEILRAAISLEPSRYVGEVKDRKVSR